MRTTAAMAGAGIVIGLLSTVNTNRKAEVHQQPVVELRFNHGRELRIFLYSDEDENGPSRLHLCMHQQT